MSDATPTSPRFIGAITCMSLTGSRPMNLGSLRITSSVTLCAACAASCVFSIKKSLPLPFSAGISPLFILCAFITIALWALCLNTSLSLTTGTAPLFIKSFNTLPAPTLGS